MKKKRLGRKHKQYPIFSCSLNSVKNNKNIFNMFKAFKNIENTENKLIFLCQTSFQCFFFFEQNTVFENINQICPKFLVILFLILKTFFLNFFR